MKHSRTRAIFAASLVAIGIVSATVVPREELEATKPALNQTKSGTTLLLDWDTRPDVFYFIEGSQDLDTWLPAKLLKDNADAGSLSLGTAIGSDKTFYRLSLEGDPNAARLMADDDGDRISNRLEAEADWDAFLSEDPTDSEPDGIPDYWELFHFGTLEHDASYVAVSAGLTLAEAYTAGTNPLLVDSDSDGWTDEQEIAWGWDPNYDQSRESDRYSMTGDFNNDGVSNATAVMNALNPADTEASTLSPAPQYMIIDTGRDREFNMLSNAGHVLTTDYASGEEEAHVWFFGDEYSFDPFSFSADAIADDGSLYGIIQHPERDELEAIIGISYPVSCDITNNYVDDFVTGSLAFTEQTPTLIKPAIELLFDYGCAYTGEYHRIMSASPNGLFVAGYANNSSLPEAERKFFYSASLNGTDMESVIKYNHPTTYRSQDIIDVNNQGDILYTFLDSSNARKYGFNGTLLDIDWAISLDESGNILGVNDGKIVFIKDGTTIPLFDGQYTRGDANLDDRLYVLSGDRLHRQNIDPVTDVVVPLTSGDAFTAYPLSDIALFKAEGWEDPHAEYISKDASFIVVSAEKNGTGHVLLLIKLDLAVHVPAELIDRHENLQTGAKIPAADEDTASNLQFVINDDNDDRRAYNVSTYPKDSDISGGFGSDEDDLVAVKLQFPSNIDTGTLEISANVDSSNPETRAYIITSVSPLKPTKELVALNPATSIDLSSASDTDLLWELVDEGEQTLYIEGLEAKDELEVKFSFIINGSEVASDSVHMQVLPSTERTLKFLAYSGMGYRAILHMSHSDNVLREDHDGYKEDKDRVTPIVFRQDGAVSSSDIPDSWQSLDVAANDGKIDAVFRRLDESPGYNVFICKHLDGAGGLARRGQGIIILGEPWVASQLFGPSKGVLAHEWLHAFANRSHVNATDDIMWGNSPPPAEVDTNNNGELDDNETMVEPGHGGNISDTQYSDFVN